MSSLPQIAALLLPMLFAGNVEASWTVTTRTDSMTDEIRKEAVTTNARGDSLSLYRLSSGAAWMTFSLSESSFDTLAQKDAPAYRVDKNKVVDLNELRQSAETLRSSMYVWQPRWINFLFWHGKESDGRGEALNSFMGGKSVVFRYYLSTGGFKETTFSLSGSSAAIADALGISPTTDVALDSKVSAYTEAVNDASLACQRMSPPRAGGLPEQAGFTKALECIVKVGECQKSAAGDATAFNKCMQ